MEQKGSMLLKVVSIIMMIGGIVSAVASFFVAIFAGLGQAVVAANGDEINAALEASGYGSVAAPVMALVWVGVVIIIAGAVFEIIAGVTGKKNWNNPEAAQKMIIFGGICAALSLIGNILFSTGTHAVQIFTILAGLVIPVLYIVGAIQLKNQG
ncbi:MAG: hypothetical protein II127_08775 [Ruminococcus sp.]|nr:hypothetical protein [Ruminococcus sp.]